MGTEKSNGIASSLALLSTNTAFFLSLAAWKLEQLLFSCVICISVSKSNGSTSLSRPRNCFPLCSSRPRTAYFSFDVLKRRENTLANSFRLSLSLSTFHFSSVFCRCMGRQRAKMLKIESGLVRTNRSLMALTAPSGGFTPTQKINK